MLGDETNLRACMFQPETHNHALYTSCVRFHRDI